MSDQPHDEEGEFIVRLMFRVPASNPRDAVARFIEQIVRYGLRPWTYRVDSDNDDLDTHLVTGSLVVTQYNGEDLSEVERDRAEQQMPVIPQDPKDD